MEGKYLLWERRKYWMKLNVQTWAGRGTWDGRKKCLRTSSFLFWQHDTKRWEMTPFIEHERDLRILLITDIFVLSLIIFHNSLPSLCSHSLLFKPFNHFLALLSLSNWSPDHGWELKGELSGWELKGENFHSPLLLLILHSPFLSS